MTRPADRILYGAPRPDGSVPYWRTPTLWAVAAGKRQVDLPLAGLDILDEVVWFGGPHNVEPTIRQVADRLRDIVNADLSYPIIMTKAGEILDGAHRIARAYLENRTHIRAVEIDDWPPPDGFAPAPEPNA